MLLARLCKTLVRDGVLTLIDADGTTHRLGRAGRASELVVRLHDRSLHYKLAYDPWLHLGEAYVDGRLTIERGDVYDVLDLYAQSVERLSARLEARWGRALASAPRFAWRHHPFSGGGVGAAPADDLSDAPWGYFLDWDRQRSCAYFTDPGMTLEEAQEAKKQHLATKLLLRPGQKVLEIGSGWGGLALHLAEAGGVEVTGLTSSPQELSVARRRAAEMELAGQVSFHLRDLGEETGQYDRVVSVGVLERLGAPRYAEFFGQIGDRLADDGVAVVHCVGRSDGTGATIPWLREPVFPGAHAPALSELVQVIERRRLWVTDVEILRLHYAETLRHWRRRFISHWEEASRRHGDRFCRRWELHLALGEVGFRRGGLVVFQIQLAKRADAVPLTREYVYDRGPVRAAAGVAA